MEARQPRWPWHEPCQQQSNWVRTMILRIFSTSSGEPIAGHNITADTPLSALPPMVVTNHLAGVDGEATEDHHTSLEDPEAPSSLMSPEEQERLMEKEYGIMRLVTAGHGISILLHSIETDIFESLCRIRRDDVVRFNGRQQEKRSNPSRENSSRARRALASRCFVTLRNSPKEAPGSTGTNVPLASSFIRCTELFGRGVGKGCGRTFTEWKQREQPR